MVVVPQELIDRLRSDGGTAESSTSDSLDAEMNRILNDKRLDDREKWKLYQQVLQRYLHFAAQNREPINLPVVESPTHTVMDDIVESFPQMYQRDARNLLRIMLRNKQLVRWDDAGTVYVNYDEKIPGSNIEDILHSIVRERKVDRIPVGWQRVMNALHKMNAPTEYINNPTALQYFDVRSPTVTGRTPSPVPSQSRGRRGRSPSTLTSLEERSPEERSPYPRYPSTRQKLAGKVKKPTYMWERYGN
jgi:hypothetical protein